VTKAKVGKGNAGGESGGSDSNSGGSDEMEELDLSANHFCGTKWLTAMPSCSNPCPPGTSCPPGETCFTATNYDKPLSPIISNMSMSLLGAEVTMSEI